MYPEWRTSGPRSVKFPTRSWKPFPSGRLGGKGQRRSCWGPSGIGLWPRQRSVRRRKRSVVRRLPGDMCHTNADVVWFCAPVSVPACVCAYMRVSVCASVPALRRRVFITWKEVRRRVFESGVSHGSGVSHALESRAEQAPSEAGTASLQSLMSPDHDFSGLHERGGSSDSAMEESRTLV